MSAPVRTVRATTATRHCSGSTIGWRTSRRASASETSAMLKLDFGVILQRWPLFVDGLVLTVELSVIATALGFVVGTLSAIGRRSGIGWLSRLCGAYVELI